MPYHVCRCGFTWQSFRELFESVRVEMAWPEDSWDSWLAGNPDYMVEAREKIKEVLEEIKAVRREMEGKRGQ